MREIEVSTIKDILVNLSQEANFNLPEDVLEALKKARSTEEAPRAQKVLDLIVRNSEIAQEKQIALCQDTGTTVLFLEIGQDVHLVGGDLKEALSEGVRLGYKEGFLRNSIVSQPFSARINTGDNTPPIVHTDIVPGDQLKLTILPKGGGCENMSRLAILRPGEGKQGIIDFALRTIEESGGIPCQPLIVVIGVGGTAEHVMHLAKKSLLRKVGDHNPDPEVSDLESELLELVNASGIGPQAWGGRSTALAVNIETYPTHITSLPVGVNLQCHSARLKSAVI